MYFRGDDALVGDNAVIVIEDSVDTDKRIGVFVPFSSQFFTAGDFLIRMISIG
ncbi:MAG: hypothetical protein IKS39_12315 [Clostridia bacterium]|nr:hypothetical protein [Clostridia bacterium]